jgi:hypothetical protein
MVRNFFNIIGVTCTCTQRGSATAPMWECEGTATFTRLAVEPSACGRMAAEGF